MHYRSVVLGGTFDHLHNGHKALLSEAFACGKRVTIGLTSDLFVRRMKPGISVAPYPERKDQLEGWLNANGWQGRYTILPLHDPYGPTISGSQMDAIVVSQETRQTAQRINTIRKEKGLPALDIREIPMIPAQDHNRISSTRVRDSEIDTEGNLILPPHMRSSLKQSIGSLIPECTLKTTLNNDTSRIIISIGDMTTQTLVRYGVLPALSAIDFQIERQTVHWDKDLFDALTSDALVLEMTSGPGYISAPVRKAIHAWSTRPHADGQSRRKRTVIEIDGEEDLLVLPVLTEAPIGSIVYYGQPKEGIVRVEVTEEKKVYAQKLLQTFIRAL